MAVSGWRILVPGLLALAACASGSGAKREAPAFEPAAFFEGRTRGEGVLAYRSGKTDQSFTVDSFGSYDEDGQFILKQVIMWSDGRQQLRTFVLQPEGEGRLEGHFAGSDKKVVLVTEGEVARLRHALPGTPFARIEQELTLDKDGRVLINEGTVRVLGFRVRDLHEVIEK